MWKKDSTGTTESQVSKRVIIGIDMGGNLWATVIHDCVMRKDRYYGLKDRDKKRKEDRFYDLLREYLGQGYAVDVFYEAGIWIRSGADHAAAGRESPYSSDQQIEGDYVREGNKDG